MPHNPEEAHILFTSVQRDSEFWARDKQSFFFPQVSGFQLFLPVAVSGMLTHLKFLGIFITLGQIIIKIVDSCMKRRENASS